MNARIPAVFLAAAAVTATLGGCVFEYPLVEGERTVRLDHVTGAPVDARTANGSVSIERADGPGVVILATIRARTTDRLNATEVSATRGDDGTLVVRAIWPDDKRRGNESCSFEITLPDAAGVGVVTDNGAISVAGLAGRADLRTGNGSIDLLDHAGEVSAESDNGRITVRNTPYPVRAETDNGAIELDAVSTPVNVRTDNGRVRITLIDEASGPVDVDTDNGSVTLFVGSGFAGRLEVASDNGSISGGPLNSRRISSGTSLTIWDFGPGEPSRIETDNGSITVRQK